MIITLSTTTRNGESTYHVLICACLIFYTFLATEILFLKNRFSAYSKLRILVNCILISAAPLSAYIRRTAFSEKSPNPNEVAYNLCFTCEKEVLCHCSFVFAANI